MRKGLLTALVASVVLLLAATALGGACIEPAIAVSPSGVATAGQTVSVVGVNFWPSTSVEVVYGPGFGYQVATAETNAAGAFTANFVMLDIDPGSYPVLANNPDAPECAAYKILELLAPPTTTTTTLPPPPTTAATLPPPTTPTVTATPSTTTVVSSTSASPGGGETTTSTLVAPTVATTGTATPSEAANSTTTLVGVVAGSEAQSTGTAVLLALLFVVFLGLSVVGGVWLERSVLSKRR